MTCGSRQEDYGLAPVEDIRDQVHAAGDRIQARREAGLTPAIVDVAIAAGQITPDGSILLPGSVKTVDILGRMKGRVPKRVGNFDRCNLEEQDGQH